MFGLPTAYCHLDSCGLVAWNDPEFLLKDMIMEKSRMSTKKDTSAMIMEKVNARLDRLETMTRSGNHARAFKMIDLNQFD